MAASFFDNQPIQAASKPGMFRANYLPLLQLSSVQELSRDLRFIGRHFVVR
jgi:hypothetical protein